MKNPIKFGTDGWRAIIADEFTFENVRRAAQATADYFKTVEGAEPAVFVGFDVRFQSKAFAAAAAEVLCANGFRVVMLDRPYPTPYVSFEVRRRKFAGGVMITASHNPPAFNGFKVKAHFGGSATPEITAKIEANLARADARGNQGVRPLVPALRDEGSDPLSPLPYFPRPYSEDFEHVINGAACHPVTISGRENAVHPAVFV